MLIRHLQWINYTMFQRSKPKYFRHNSNKCWSKFVKNGKHIRLSKLIEMIDDSPHMTIFEYYRGKMTASIRHWTAQQLTGNTNNSLFHGTKESLHGVRISVRNVYRVLRCKPITCNATDWLSFEAQSCPVLLHLLLKWSRLEIFVRYTCWHCNQQGWGLHRSTLWTFWTNSDCSASSFTQ